VRPAYLSHNRKSKGEILTVFDYARPETLETAIALLGERPGSARPLAGGTDLLVQIRAERYQLDRVVDIKAIPELNELRFTPGEGLTLGAASPCYRIYEHPELPGAYPGLADSTSIVGGIAIQGRASVGGNLCNASPSADTIPALIVHRATCRIVGPAGARTLAVSQFCTAPGVTALQPGELLVSLHLPPPQPRSGAHYLRFIPRNEMDIAVVGAGAWVVLSEDGRTIMDAQLALGAVAPTPLDLAETARQLIGTDGSEEILDAVASAAQDAARPITDMRGSTDQRRHLVGVLTRRAIRGALRRAQGEEI